MSTTVPQVNTPREPDHRAPDDLQQVFERQRQAFDSSPSPTLEARLRSLDRLAQAIGEQAPALASAISADFGNRSVHETYLLELVPLQNAIRHAKRNLRRWIRPERRRVDITSQPGAAWVQYQPLGVVGIVSPWNYPLSLALIPLVDALAAGNRVLLKLPDLTPSFSALLQRVLSDAFAREEVAAIVGGLDVAERFVRLPLNHLLFTGSTAIGRKVAAAAAERLTPVTLELGGKSPVIICPDYDPGAAARDITFAKLATAGQTCVAPDYVLAPAAKVQIIADAVLAEARRMYPSVEGNPDCTSIISDRHLHRLRNAIEEARLGGAEILGADYLGSGRQLRLSVVLRPPLTCALMREEIFGPVLPIVSYDTLDEAIAFVNGMDKPLALYCLTHDRASRDAVLGRTMSGGVTVNGALLHQAQDNLPFGGVGPSGIGSYHGRAGFLRFSHARGIYQVRGFNALHFLTPPYGKVARLVIRILGSRQARESV
jgi:coniferyl-aldehyde dehydrogenase